MVVKLDQIRSSMKLVFCLIFACAFLLQQPFAQSPERRDNAEVPLMTVQGRGEVQAFPDRVRIRLGAVAQARQASTAQIDVNRTVERAIQELLRLGVPNRAIRTVGVSLVPVYDHRLPPGGPPRRHGAPEISGYRASNVLQIELDDLGLAGEVIDAGISAGANQVESVTFHLRDDLAAREQALAQAFENARTKARALAQAANVNLGAVREVAEVQHDPIRPMEAQRAMMLEAGAPLQPGEINVQAAVMVRFLIENGPPE
jgi:uncharacterized protein